MARKQYRDSRFVGGSDKMLQDLLVIDMQEVLRRAAHGTSGLATRLAIRLRSGTVMVEYAIMVALIAIVAMAAVQALGVGIVGVFQRILGSITNIG